MKEKFVTFVRGQATDNPSFDLVIHGDGQGKFNVRKLKSDVPGKQSYSVTSPATAETRFQEFLESVPSSIEKIFNLGVTGLGYYEGEITVHFPLDFQDSLSAEDLENISNLAVDGMSSLSERYLQYVEQDLQTVSVTFYAGLWAVLVILLISLLGYFYGSRIIALDWMLISGIMLAVQLPVVLLLTIVMPEIREINKLIIFSLIGANSILLTMLVGFFSLYMYSDRIVPKEGIVEYVFEGQRMSHLMRVRMAENKHRSYLVPKKLLNKAPEYLPVAVSLKVREGLFGTRYIDSVVVIN